MGHYFNAFVKLTDSGVAIIRDGTLVWVNGAFCKFLKQGPDLLVGSSIYKICPTLEIPKNLDITFSKHSFKYLGADLDEVLVKLIPVGENTWAISLNFRELRENSPHELELYKDRFWKLTDQSPSGIVLSDVGLRLEYVNPAVCSIFGAPSAALIGTGWLEKLEPGSRDELEAALISVLSGEDAALVITVIRASNDIRHVKAKFTPISSEDKPHGFVGSLEDITETLAYKDQLERAAYTDALTGLPNRLKLSEYLSDLASNSAHKSSLILFCDIDGFKKVNDTLGHLAGDRLLIEFAKKIRNLTVVKNYEVFRYAGDEFIIVIPGGSEEEAAKILKHVSMQLKNPLILGSTALTISASIGHAKLNYGDSYESVIINADQRMYEAKRSFYETNHVITPENKGMSK